MRKRFDDTKPCSWCNPCPASFCDCGECKDESCKACYPKIEMPPKIQEVREWTDEDSEGAGGDQ